MGQKGGYDGTLHPANVTKMRLFEARGDTDQNEGRGGTFLVGWFTDEAIAKKAVEDKGVMGTLGYVKDQVCDVAVFKNGLGEDVIGIIKEYIQIDYEDPRETRAKALAKLTPKERKALGL